MKVLSVLLAILACYHIANGYRILGVFPFNGHSHSVMMEPFMKGLLKRGHQVDVITHFPQKKPVPNYTDISLAGSLPTIINNVTATDIKGFNTFTMENLIYMAGTQICELLNHPRLRNLIENPPQDPPYDIVIAELFLAPCYLAFGRHLKVPTIGVVTCVFHDWLYEPSGNPLNIAFTPSMFSRFHQRMSFKERILNVLLTNWISMQVQYYTNFQLQYIKESFDMDVPNIKDFYKDIALYLVNSHHLLHGIKPMTPGIVEVAGLHIKDEDDPLSPEVKKWLDESKDGCVYFTFGSMVRIETFPDELMKQFYASFKKIAPVRVLMKVARKEDLLPGLPENVMTQSWFQQVSVLKHKNIRAFITHGGLMGTQEAIYCGVPMIGIPLFGDQFTNIQNYNKKVAISLNSVDEVTEEKLTSALNSILKDPSYRENMQRISTLFRDRPMSPLDTSVYWVEYVAKYGKVLESPAIHLYWWQQNALDVDVALLAIIITVLWIVLFIARNLKKLLFGSHVCAKKNSTAIKSKKNK